MNKKLVIVVLLSVFIFAVGIFLRTFHFGDWLILKSDQARDAIIMEKSFQNGFSSLPLLGPQVGGTPFRLGPVSYYFQYFSGKIFSPSPESFAYPDLLWGILTLPFLFFFLKKFLPLSISLWLTALASVSLFLVTFSRFGWNPNGLPFFTTLFAWLFAKLLEAEGKQRWKLLVAASLCLGIIFQLHFAAALSLAFGLLIFLILFKPLSGKEIFLSLLIVLFSHTPMLISEWKTNGENGKEFIQAFNKKESLEAKHAWHEKLFRAYQENSSFTWLLATGLQNTDPILTRGFSLKCDKKCAGALPYTLLSLILFSGIAVFSFFAWKETLDPSKKKLLSFIFLWLGGFFLLTIFLAYQIETRFYLGVVPAFFLTTGLAIEKISRLNVNLYWKYLLLSGGIILLALNIQNTSTYLKYLSLAGISAEKSSRDLRFGSEPKVTLSQMRAITKEASEKFDLGTPVIVTGESHYVKSIFYLVWAEQNYNSCYFRGKKQQIPDGFNQIILDETDPAASIENNESKIFFGTLTADFQSAKTKLSDNRFPEECLTY